MAEITANLVTDSQSDRDSVGWFVGVDADGLGDQDDDLPEQAIAVGLSSDILVSDQILTLPLMEPFQDKVRNLTTSEAMAFKGTVSHLYRSHLHRSHLHSEDNGRMGIVDAEQHIIIDPLVNASLREPESLGVVVDLEGKDVAQALQFTEPQFELEPGGIIPSTFFPSTGDARVDGLLENRKWGQASLSYSFPDSLSGDYGSTYDNYNRHVDGFTTAPPGLQSAIKYWLGNISEVVPLSFLQATHTGSHIDGPNAPDTVLDDGDATIRVAMSNDPIPAYAYLPHSSDEAGDAWFNQHLYGDWFTQAQMGDYGWHTIGHELSHTLGLKHGHEQGGVAGVALPSAWDTMEFSIMTYRTYENQELGGPYTNADGHYAQSLMVLDILALQTLYGANFTTHAGDTVYGFSPTTGELLINGRSQGTPTVNTIFRTLWDGNGTDTYDLSNYTTPLLLDLTPGGYSDFDMNGTAQQASLNGWELEFGSGNASGNSGSDDPIYARGHVFNAFLFNDDPRSLIENAIGGTADDQIIGNQADNRLQGEAGSDRLWGHDGDDRLLDGSGEDWLTGGAGADVFILAADHQVDRITDFDGKRDRLDLTAWAISDRAQLQISDMGTGTQLQYRQETLYLAGVHSTAFDLKTVILGELTDTKTATAQNLLAPPLFSDDPFGRSNIASNHTIFVGEDSDVHLRSDDDETDDLLPGEPSRDRPASSNDALTGSSGVRGSTAVNTNLSEADEVNQAASHQVEHFEGSIGQDTFVLGDVDQPYYTTAGRDDYAWIWNFHPADDALVLHGSANRYSTAIANGHTELWLNPTAADPAELIAYFAQTPNLLLEGSSVQYV
ncbi:MAG: M10 family metallopeptidase [Leptolyngbyaceae cyanobacterium]